MTVKEFREKQDLKYDHFFNLTSTGISPNYDNMEKFAEEYHQDKLKLLGIGGVSQQRELLNGFRQWLIDKKKNINIYQHLIDEYLNTI
tara:strand:+ start:1338 stop:1601 length:264 start_codon:yes stop_codon:yes gene_type:complete